MSTVILMLKFFQPPAHRPTSRLEQSKDVPSTSTQNAQKDTSGAEAEKPTTPSTPARRHESSEAMEQEEEQVTVSGG